MGSLAHRPQTARSLALVTPVEAFESLPEAKREAALARRVMLQPALQRMDCGVSAKQAALYLSAVSGDGTASAKTLEKWLNDYRRDGLMGLVDKRTGRRRGVYGWEARAQYHYTRPTRPCAATVARWLREEGFDAATESRVRNYLGGLPTNQGTHAPSRVGTHYHRQNLKPYVIRDATVLPVGFVYQGDGHTCDVYVAHPSSGGHYRPELTMWIDIRSRRIVSWWLSESESALTTLFSFSAALVDNNHVPAEWHVDPGSGFMARIHTDEVTGFLARFSVRDSKALPGNAKGKGLIEHLFAIFEERVGKRFTTYCGHCRTDDALSRLAARIKKGDIKLPSFIEYRDAVAQFVATWNSETHKGLDGQTPDELWKTLERVPLETPAAAVVRPRVQRVATRSGVQLHGRLYRSPVLMQFERKSVVLEYSLTSDQVISVLDDQGRYVCDATLVQKTPWLPESRIEEGQQRRLVGQQKRLQARLDEASARANAAIPGQLLTPIAADFAQALPAQTKEAEGLPPLDLLDLDYSAE